MSAKWRAEHSAEVMGDGELGWRLELDVDCLEPGEPHTVLFDSWNGEREEGAVLVSMLPGKAREFACAVLEAAGRAERLTNGGS